MALLAPLALIGLGLIIPVLLLYMLRLRRREVVISSTFLWQQVLRDQEANTPWQRLRRNLLLIIQLIALILLVLALTRPFIIVPAVSAARTIVLIDASASMNATDSPDGTRLDEARRRAREIVDTLNAGAEASILRVADTVEVLAPYTADRAALSAALDGLTPGVGGADWDAALTLAAGTAGAVANEADFAVILISDGGALSGAALPIISGTFEYIPVGSSAANAALSALAVRALPGGPPQLFAQVTNYGPDPVEVIVDLRVDGELFTAERIAVPGNGVAPFILDDLPDEFTVLTASLTRPGDATIPDILASDDAAYAVAPVTAARRVLLAAAGGNLFLEQVFRTLPGISLFTADPAGGLPRGSYDLTVLDGWLPADLPDGDLLIVNPPASTALFTVGEPITVEADAAALANPRTLRDNGAGIDVTLIEAAGGLGTINIGALLPVTAAWASPVAVVEGGPLVLAGTQADRQIALLAFDLRATDLPLQIAFPALMATLIDWYAPADRIAVPASTAAGSAMLIRPPAGAALVRVTLPDGRLRDLPVERAEVTLSETAQAGLYQIEALDASGTTMAVAWAAVNAYRAAESDVQPRTVVRLGSAEIGGAPADDTGQRELWPWLAAAALIVILLEWWMYYRRQRMPGSFRPLARLRRPG